MNRFIDHRQLADEMEIFAFNESVGAGLPLWLPIGAALRDALEDFIRRLEASSGYQRVVSPHIAKASLYERSGHEKYFSGEMFPAMEGENERFRLRPMNCPHHHLIFSSLPRSYRQLPLRLAEYGQVYRFEPSGSLRGLSRVRGLCQNDAHIYVEPERASEEVVAVLRLHERAYRALGLKGYRYRLSKCDPNRMQEFEGSLREWQAAEEILERALIDEGLSYFEAQGEAAFYGPKIDVQMGIGNSAEESIASLQLDFNSGRNFDLRYVDSDGKSKAPWIIHRAPLGSHERFIALLLEYYQGMLPAWLSPIQVMVVPVDDDHLEACRKLVSAFQSENVRARVYDGRGGVSKKLKHARRLRPAGLLVVGEEELQSEAFSLSGRIGDFCGRSNELLSFVKERCEPPK